MVEANEAKENQTRGRNGATLLTICLAASLSTLLAKGEVLPDAEAFVVSYSFAFLVGYWIPPRPALGFRRWAIESLILIVGFYAALFKFPTWLRLRMHAVLAYAIPMAVFIPVFIILWKKDFFNFGKRAGPSD